VTWFARLCLAIGLTASVVACGAPARLAPAPTAQPCGQVYSDVRCDLIVDVVAEQAGVDREDVVAIQIAPEPTPEVQLDGTEILSTRSGGARLIVDAQLRDGTVHREAMCGGISAAFVPVCMDEPRLQPMSLTISGYRDVPCFDDEGQHCATPHPPIDPEAAGAADPIRMEQVDIPIDHEGAYEVRLGEGSLPNGILTEATFDFVIAWPPDVTIPDGRVLLDVRSLEPDGKPFDNYYLHGRREGIERVEAVLVFTVSRFEPGAVLMIRDVVVR
jgi:hypothetical protein